ncbi:MAG: hypothetical protein FJW20_20495 [Acidimicrobiia bacterium]|nr:hypothetical protein [Acidimicrobiia bacterium]
MAVTNVFGERIWVEAAGRGLDDDWQRWAMFPISIQGKGRQVADSRCWFRPPRRRSWKGARWMR